MHTDWFLTVLAWTNQRFLIWTVSESPKMISQAKPTKLALTIQKAVRITHNICTNTTLFFVWLY